MEQGPGLLHLNWETQPAIAFNCNRYRNWKPLGVHQRPDARLGDRSLYRKLEPERSPFRVDQTRG